ncbi:hypothetical protein [Maribacter sp. R77961]|uniref:hypothetical protein n=1 Tax=Maribacter sp. R77961 TaxID=3093871 RepID=UPI0037CC2FDE
MTTIKAIVTKVPSERLYLGSMLLLFGSYYLYNQISAWVRESYLEGTDAQLFKALIIIGGIVCKLAWSAVILSLLYTLANSKSKSYTSTIIYRFVRYSLVAWTALLLVSILQPQFIIKNLTYESNVFIAPYLWKYVIGVFLFTVSNVISYYYVLQKQFTPLFFSIVIGIFQFSMLLIFHNGINIVIHVQLMAMVTLLVLQILYFGYSSAGKTIS